MLKFKHNASTRHILIHYQRCIYSVPANDQNNSSTFPTKNAHPNISLNSHRYSLRSPLHSSSLRRGSLQPLDLRQRELFPRPKHPQPFYTLQMGHTACSLPRSQRYLRFGGESSWGGLLASTFECQGAADMEKLVWGLVAVVGAGQGDASRLLARVSCC